MIAKNNKNLKIILSALFLLVFAIVFLMFSVRARAAGTGTINVNSNLANTVISISPGSYSATVVTVNQVVAITNVPAGTYTASCPDNKNGYTVTDPASQTLTSGGSITFTCNYIAVAVPIAFLKDLGYTTAEILVFTPSTSNPTKKWSLLEGVAEVSVESSDPTKSWQKSSAEILYIGTLATATITKTSDQRFIVGGSSANYKIDFHVNDTKNQQYPATVTDTISVADPSQYGEVSIDVAGTTANNSTVSATDSVCLAGGITAQVTTVINDVSTPKTVTFTLPAATRNCTFELLVKLNFAFDIASNTVIHDEAKISTAETTDAVATYDTLAIGPFTQEKNGGDIYAKGALNFGQLPTGQYGGEYVIGSDGNIQNTTSASKSGWTLGSYGIRSGTTDNFDPDACTVSGSACKVMNDNITRLKKGATTLTQDTINGTFPTNITGMAPEGWVYYKNGDLTIGGDTTFQGKGTIIIDGGNLYINGNITYSASTPSILGIIVKNGNVVISGDPSVTTISGIFYIFSDENAGQKGQFITNANSLGDDVQLTINGSVIASGYYANSKRNDAFVLARRYVGDPNELKNYITLNPGAPIPDSYLHPAELFIFDSRIIVMPPPGFSGKIVGNM